MAAKKEKIGVEMLVEARMDPRSSAKVIKDAADLHKKLSRLKLDWTDVAKKSSASLNRLKDISAAASAFSGKLSSAANASYKELSKLSEKLEDAHDQASKFERQLSKARTPGAKKEAAAGLGAAQKQIVSLNKQISDHKKAGSQYGRELYKVIKAQRTFRSGLEKTAKYTGSDLLKSMGYDPLPAWAEPCASAL